MIKKKVNKWFYALGAIGIADFCTQMLTDGAIKPIRLLLGLFFN